MTGGSMNASMHMNFNARDDIIILDTMHQSRTPLFWSIERSDGVIQGPLDLCCLRDRSLVLALDSRQVAILCLDGEMQKVYLNGHHTLDPIEDSTDGVSYLYFLHLDSPISVPWRQHIPVAPTSAGDPTSRLAHGTFVIQIIDPIRFFRSFLMSKTGEGEGICLMALAHLLPTFLALRLAHVCGSGATFEMQNKAVAKLQGADLDTVLSPYGIECLAITMNSGIQQTAKELAMHYNQPELVGCS